MAKENTNSKPVTLLITTLFDKDTNQFGGQLRTKHVFTIYTLVQQHAMCFKSFHFLLSVLSPLPVKHNTNVFILFFKLQRLLYS